MGKLIFIIVVLVFMMCISLFNYWFQKEKYNRLSKEERKNSNPFSSPSAWIVYFVILLLFTLGILSYYIYMLMLEIRKMS